MADSQPQPPPNGEAAAAASVPVVAPSPMDLESLKEQITAAQEGLLLCLIAYVDVE